MTTDIQRNTQIYVIALSGAAIAMCVGLVAAGYDLGTDPWTVAALIVVSAIAERSGVWLTRSAQVSIALLPTLFAAVLFGPLAAGIVCAASMLGDAEVLSRSDPLRAPRLKLASYASSRFVEGAAAGIVAQSLLGHTTSEFGGLLVATFAAAVVAEVIDVIFVAIVGRIRRTRTSPTSLLKTVGSMLLTTVPLYAPTVAILALAYIEFSPWTALLFFIPALAAQRLLGMYEQQRQLAEELKRANMSFAEALVATLEKSDQYTAGHSKAVAITPATSPSGWASRPTSRSGRTSAAWCTTSERSGFPRSLLLKDGPLTLEERRQMQEHPAIGRRFSRRSTSTPMSHWWCDITTRGSTAKGYPDKIAGDEIPLLSRIIAVADAYNAMTSNRPYREAMPSRVARLRLAQAVESQFDTSAVAASKRSLLRPTRNTAPPSFGLRAELRRGSRGIRRRARRRPTRSHTRSYSEPPSPDGSSATARRVRTALIASAVLDLTPSLSNT